MNRETREIVASDCGERSENTCRILWGRVPSAYKEAIVFSAYWGAYQAVSPGEQHRPVGKETGETAHIERWNNTLRQQLTRFVRKTLSFSNCIKMHEIFLKFLVVMNSLVNLLLARYHFKNYHYQENYESRE